MNRYIGPPTDQNAEENERFPPNWSESIDDFYAAESMSIEAGVNVLCGFRPDRINYSHDPNDVKEDVFGRFHHLPWAHTPDELRYWNYLREAQKAANKGELKTLPPEDPDPDMLEMRRNAGESSPPITPSQCNVKPKELLIWAYKNLSDLPDELLEGFDPPEENTMSDKQIITKLRRDIQKNEKIKRNLVATCALLLEYPEAFNQGRKTSSLESVLDKREEICEIHSREVLGFSPLEKPYSKRRMENLIQPVRDSIRSTPTK
jgi:hypothetical protein